MEIAASHDAISEVDNGSTEFIRWGDVDRDKDIVLVSWDARSAASSFFASTIHQSLVMHAHLQSVLGKQKSLWSLVLEEWVLPVQPPPFSRWHWTGDKFCVHLSHQSRAWCETSSTSIYGQSPMSNAVTMYFGMGTRARNISGWFSKSARRR